MSGTSNPPFDHAQNPQPRSPPVLLCAPTPCAPIIGIGSIQSFWTGFSGGGLGPGQGLLSFVSAFPVSPAKNEKYTYFFSPEKHCPIVMKLGVSFGVLEGFARETQIAQGRRLLDWGFRTSQIRIAASICVRRRNQGRNPLSDRWSFCTAARTTV